MMLPLDQPKRRRRKRRKFSKPSPVVCPEPSTKSQAQGSSGHSSWQGQFDSSRLPFQVRRWLPVRQECLPQLSVLQCGPPAPRPPATCGSSSPHLNTTSRTQQRRPRSTPVLRPPSQQQRPPSTAALTPVPSVAVTLDSAPLEDGDFNTLSPELICQLLKQARPSVPWSPPCGDSALMNSEEKGKGQKDSKVNDDLSTTSGVESDGGDDDVSEEDEDRDEEADDDDDDSSDSENEGFEPSLDDLRRQMPNPRSVFFLRPEQLDDASNLEEKPDQGHFEFDTKKNDQPLYEFKCPLPDFLRKIDLRKCAREKINWRDLMTTSCDAVETSLQGMLDRLVGLEKMQVLTENWEARRLRGRLRRQERTLMLNSNNSGSRASSGRQREKRCHYCYQPACSGDCLERRTATTRCVQCGQSWCVGTCQVPRGPDSQDLGGNSCPATPPSSPSKAYMSFPKRSAKARLINANQLMVQPRPKSSVLADSRGKSSSVSRQHGDYLRPASVVSVRSSSLFRDFERLGVDAPQPVPPNKVPRPRTKSPYSGFLVQDKTAKSNSSNSSVCRTDTLSAKRKRNKISAGLKVVQGSS